MHVIYVAPVCSEAAYQRLAQVSGKTTAYEVQKYHRLFAEGLAASAKVDVIAGVQLPPDTHMRGLLSIPDDTEAGVAYHYPKASANRFLKMACMFFGTFRRTWQLARKDSAVIIDCLSMAGGLAAVLAARLRGCPAVSVVTDLPDMFEGARMLKLIGNLIIRKSSGYVVLTPLMVDYIQEKLIPGTKRKFTVIEGNADAAMEQKKPSPEIKKKPRICLYAGNINAIYGIRELLEGFCLANIPDTQLHIYGAGDYTEAVKERARNNPCVRYGGVLFSDQIVQAEQEATLLVNPRPTGYEFTKYSFPSKTMEYMSSGTPVLMTQLPSLPEEYKPYLMFIRDETAEGIAQALQEAFSHSDEELFSMGSAARTFILRERNNIVQAKKVLEMCETLTEGKVSR